MQPSKNIKPAYAGVLVMKPRSCQVLLWLITLALLSGCAGVPTQEMSDARQALQAARDVGAANHAPASLDSAERLLISAEQGLGSRRYKQARQEALASKQEAVKARGIAAAVIDAKNAAVEVERAGFDAGEAGRLLSLAERAEAAGDEAEAVRLAQEARTSAEESLRQGRERQAAAERDNRTWSEQTAALLDEARTHRARMSSDHLAALGAVEQAHHNNEGKRAHDLAEKLVTELRAIPELPRMLRYVVQHGDTLWRIAAKTEVYGNPWHWPLILAANQAELDDAHDLEPGLVLQIPLLPTTEQEALAAQHALECGPWASGQRKVMDCAYLEAAGLR